jgi:hypothetical protein
VKESQETRREVDDDVLVIVLLAALCTDTDMGWTRALFVGVVVVLSVCTDIPNACVRIKAA